MPLSIPSDQELWRLFIVGDESAFERLFKRNYPKLLQYGRKFSNDNEFIKDAIQELFAELWQQRAHLSATPAVRQYLYKSLRRKMLRLSSNRPVGYQLDEQADLFHVTLSAEHILIENEGQAQQREQLAHLLTFLTPRQREAIYLRFYHDMDYNEMASVMNVETHTIRNLIYEALKLLRSRLLPILLYLFLHKEW